MCEWGTTLPFTTPDGREVPIDACLLPLVRALNEGGILTIASCCGHGKDPGSVLLADGGELVVLKERR